ncbi:MAG: ABC-F family ATP-binding cassette domain-containing protein [Bacteroidales bacterium]|jgi:ATP-binding cassette subfamily F protein uup|nr:ABC-F family ATP-binding cassette domain-containing protein [Bacteroidales bacterium]
MSYLQVNQLAKSYGDIELFSEIGLTINADSRMALIARNGAGKTSLLNILAGKDTPNAGSVILMPDVRVGYLEQDPDFDPALTAFHAVFSSSEEMVQVISDYEQALTSGDGKALERAMERMDHMQAWDYEARIKQILGRLKIAWLDQPVGQLSGGQKKRIALANLLINEPELLLLDEPTNHLDLDMVEWLEEYLRKTRSAFLMVTHDRYFLDRVCNEIIELDRNDIYRYKGNYSYYLEKCAERTAIRQAETEKAKNLYRTELEWMRRMPQARGHKAKYRVDAFDGLKTKAHRRNSEKNMELNVQSARMGGKILVLEHVSKRFDDTVILRDFSYTFSRNEKVGIIGKNGTGKTTFLNIITGSEPVDAGMTETGETIVYGYYRQAGIDFRAGQRVIEIVKDIAETVTVGDGRQVSASQFLTEFLFPPEMQYIPVEKLSGGERRRLYLATILIRNPNFLILDEPTNDLDIVTLHILEDYLQSFRGCLLIVSHDRYFMDRLVDHIFVFEGSGDIRDYTGNYTEYRNLRLEQEAEEARSTQAQKTVEPKPAKENRNKLTYREKKELEELEASLAALEEEKQGIEQMLGSGASAHDGVVKASARMADILAETDAKTDRWLELSEKEG